MVCTKKFVLLCMFVSAVNSELNTNIWEDLNWSNFYHKFSQRGKFLEGKLSEECTKQIDQISQLIDDKEFPFWLIKMIDATAKLQSGIFDGNLYNLGSFSECLSINDDSNGVRIKGQYCLGQLNLGELIPIRSKRITPSLNWALCLPDKCNGEDLELLTNKTNVFDFTKARCSTVESNNPPLDAGDISYITILSIVLLLIILSTSYDIYCINFSAGDKKELLCSFSFITNGRKLLSTSTSSDQLQCLSGIRALSMMWIILSHLFLVTSLGPMANMTMILDFFKNGWTMYVRGATVSVDTFFLMSGIVMVYVFLKSNHRGAKKFNIFLYYLHRYLRLTPALAAMVFFHITVLKHFGSGPVWSHISDIGVSQCRKYWWSTLLYIQNIVNPVEMCMGPSWYLSADMQMFLVSPLILLPLKRYPRLTLAGVSLAACASMSYTFALSYIDKLKDTNADNVNQDPQGNYMKMIYVQTHARAAPWLFGCVFGFYIYEFKMVRTNFKINRILNLVLWALSLAVLLTVLFYDNAQDEYDRLAMSFYIALNRPAWALALGWIIFSCVMGYGGLINKFLSLPIFQILAKLTYSMFITHFTFELMVVLSTEDVKTMNILLKNYEFWSAYMTLVFIATIWTLAFESPIIILEKLLLTNRRSGTDNKHNTQHDKDNEKNDLASTSYDNKGFENEGPNCVKIDPRLLKVYNER